jgi:hypothetical protein
MAIYEVTGVYETDDGNVLFFTDSDTTDGERLAEIAEDFDSIEELVQYVKDNRDVFMSRVYIYKANWEEV